MGLLGTIANALGLRRPLVPQHAGPFSLTDAGLVALNALPEGQALHVATAPTAGGRYVEVWQGTAEGALREDLGGPVVVSDDDLQHLAGLELDHHDGRWRVVLSLTVHAGETPNPDGRLYKLDRYLAEGPPLYFTPDPANPLLARKLLEIEHARSVLLRENTLTIGRERGASWDAIDRGVDAAVREYLLLCGKPLTRAARSRRSDPLESAVLEVLEDRILPGVHRDGGDIELIEIADGVVRVHLVGACASCPATMVTLHQGVEKVLRDAFPGEIERVEQV